MGCVYIFTNEGYQGLVIIGFTGGTAEERAIELSRSTGLRFHLKLLVPYIVKSKVEQLKAEGNR